MFLGKNTDLSFEVVVEGVNWKMKDRKGIIIGIYCNTLFECLHLQVHATVQQLPGITYLGLSGLGGLSMKLLLVALEMGMTDTSFNTEDSEITHQKQIIKPCYDDISSFNIVPLFIILEKINPLVTLWTVLYTV